MSRGWRVVLQVGIWSGMAMLVTAPHTALAVIYASDNANNAAYSDGWTIGDNGGTGFGPWGGSGSYGIDPVMEIDTSPAESDNNLGTPAFRIGTGGVPEIGGGYGFSVTRPFSNAMQAGQSFRIDFDDYPLDRGTPPGGDLLIKFQSSGGERVSMYGYFSKDYNFGSDNWGINATSANDNQAGGASLPLDPLGGIDWQSNYTLTDGSDGFSLQLDIVTADTYRLRIVDHNVTKLDVSGQMYAATAGQAINGLVIYGSDIGYDMPTVAGQNVYFNNLQILDTPSAGVSGDYNNNGVVDAADYVVWRKGGPLFNDPTPAGVSPADYTYWRSRFGATSGSGAGSGLGGANSVPEASSFVLSMIGLGAVAAWRRRSRQVTQRERQ